jgi:hypothetical protein
MQNQYVIQVYADLRFYVYEWTPAIVRRSDVIVLTEEEAEHYLGLMKQGVKKLDKHPRDIRHEKEFGHPREQVDVDPTIEFAPEDDGEAENPVLEAIPTARPLDDSKPLSWTQDQLLEREFELIRPINKKADLEAYMLERYRIPLAPGSMTRMKAAAREALEALMKQNQLIP